MLAESISSTAANLQEYDTFTPGMTKKEKEAYFERQQEIGRHNWPYDHKIYELNAQIQQIIKSL
jgi:hypothetical protein